MSQLASMTGFARAEGTIGGIAWIWELRSVNGRGLDLRFRLPPGWDSLEPALRNHAASRLRRGSVTANLTVRREREPHLVLDAAALEQALQFAIELGGRIPGSAPPQPEALLALPGVMRPATLDQNGPDLELAPSLQAGFEQALTALGAARSAEGERLGIVLHRLLDEIDGLYAQARTEAADQPAQQRTRLMENLRALLRDSPGLPEERIAQEVALLATRSDIREELDRLASHIAAARGLIAEGTAIGRRFDFLVQEFNREANTLCSKSASAALTATGLRLKAAIEQLREQVQNIE
jgi:uncharacterized protein (TIGR00255 family)